MAYKSVLKDCGSDQALHFADQDDLLSDRKGPETKILDEETIANSDSDDNSDVLPVYPGLRSYRPVIEELSDSEESDLDGKSVNNDSDYTPDWNDLEEDEKQPHNEKQRIRVDTAENISGDMEKSIGRGYKEKNIDRGYNGETGTGNKEENLTRNNTDENANAIQLSDSSDDDTSVLFDEKDLTRDPENTGIFMRKVQFSQKDSKGKLKKHERVYNAYQCCWKCSCMVSNFAQHASRVHANEEEVQDIFSAAGNPSEVKKKWTILRALGNHTNNCKTLQRKKGELLLERRPTKQFRVKDYGPCPLCLMWTSKKLLWKHQRKCPARTTDMPILKSGSISTQSDAASGRLLPTASKKLITEVFAIMRNDDISEVAKADPLIVMLGNMWMQKNVGNQLKRGKYTSSVMRLAARLLINLRKITNTKNRNDFSSYLTPEHFDHLVKATILTAAGDMDSEDDLMTPSNAIKLGFDIKRLINAKIGLEILNQKGGEGKSVQRIMAEDLQVAVNIFWGTRVTKLARTILEEHRKTKDLPSPNDLQKLALYLREELKKMDTSVADYKTYYRMATLVQVKILVYNRRRTGELEATKLSNYLARLDAGETKGQIGDVNLSDFEEFLLKTQAVMEIRGKTGRRVPVILPEVVMPGLKYIANTKIRQAAGVQVENKYLFANTGNGVIRAYDSLHKICLQADLEMPQRITSTSLRKYMATITQVLDLKENHMTWVTRHFGHTLDVHEAHYQQTHDLIERVDIAKLLLIQDMGRVAEFKNKSLKDIQLNDIMYTSEEVEHDMEPRDQDAAQLHDKIMHALGGDDRIDRVLDVSEKIALTEEKEGEEQEESVDTPKQKRPNTKKTWTKEEEKEIKLRFSNYFEEQKRPPPDFCAKVIKASAQNGGLLALRKKDVLKKKVFRMIDSLKDKH